MSDANDRNGLPRQTSLDSGAPQKPAAFGGALTRFWKKIRQSMVEPVERRQRRLETGLASQADVIARLEAAADADRARFADRMRALDKTASDAAAGTATLSNEIETLRADHMSLKEVVGRLQNVATKSIPALEGDAARARDHLARLQEDHSALKQDVAAMKHELKQQLDELVRLETLWKDLHHDLTGLAVTLSGVRGEGPSR